MHARPGVRAGEARIERRSAWVLAAGLAIALLVVALGPHRIGDYATETDFYGGYADGARMIQHGRLDPARYGVVGPGYEVALAVAGWVVRDLFTAAELLSVLAAVAMLIAWFHLLARWFDTRVALFAAAFIAANPHFFRFGYTASTDALALALQAGSLFLLFGRSGPGTALAAGLLAAAAFLTRYSAIVLLPIGLIVTAAGRRGPQTAAEAAAEAAPATGGLRPLDLPGFAAGWLVPVGVWYAYALAHGAGVGAQLHHNIAYEVFARARGIGWDTYQRDLQSQFPTLWSVIARDPAAVVIRLASNAVSHLRDDARLLLGWATAIAALLGLLLGASSGALRRAWPLLLAAALTFLAFVPAFHSERYSLALLPYYATAVAAFFASHRFALEGWRGWLKAQFIVFPLGLSLGASVDLQRATLAQQPTEALVAAETLRALAGPGDRVIARKPHVAAIAGVGAVGFPFEDSLGGLAAYARQHRARWLFFGFPESEARPAFRYLLDTTATVPGLTPRSVTSPRPSVLYEIGPGFGARPPWFDNDTLVNLHAARAEALASPGDPRPLRTAGTIELARGELAAARGHLERAADLSPNDPDILLPLGETLMRLGDLSLAARAYQRADMLFPGNIQARIGRGWVSLLAGREAEAAQYWRGVIPHTRSAGTLEQMRALYRRLGDETAVAEVEAAIRSLEAR